MLLRLVTGRRQAAKAARGEGVAADQTGGPAEGSVEVDLASLEPAHRMGLEALGRAFDAAGEGRDWFAMDRELGRVKDAVRAVWYAAKVRDDGAQ